MTPPFPFVALQFVNVIPVSVSGVERDVNSNTLPFPEDRVISRTFTSEEVKVPELKLKMGEECRMEGEDEIEREVRERVPVEDRKKREEEREEGMERENVLNETIPSPTVHIV